MKRCGCYSDLVLYGESAGQVIKWWTKAQIEVGWGEPDVLRTRVLSNLICHLLSG